MVLQVSIFKPFQYSKIFVLPLIFSLSFTFLYGQDIKVVYVNETTIHNEYNQLQEYHNEYVIELQEADRDFNRKTRELDSLHQESINQSAETTSLNNSDIKDKELKNHMKYIRDLQEQYNQKTLKCEEKIEEVIEGIMKEEGYSSWEAMKSGEDVKEGTDITTQVLLKLNQ